MRACVFTAAGATWALPVSQVVELCPESGLTPVPGAPPRVLGVFHRRGAVIPVVRLGDETTAGSASGLLVLECRQGTVATPVEAVQGIADVTPGEGPTLLDLDASMIAWSEEVAEAFEAHRHPPEAVTP